MVGPQSTCGGYTRDVPGDPMGQRRGGAGPPSKGCWPIPTSSSSGAGSTRRRRTAWTSAPCIGHEPLGVAATADVDDAARRRRRLRALQPHLRRPGVVTRILESGKNVVTPLGWFYPPSDERDQFDAVCRSGRRDPARHGHPSRRHHRAVPAGALGPVGLDHPRAGRGVLRHPHLRRPRRHPRLDALRQDARGGPHEHHGRRPGRRLPPVGVDGGRRARLRPRSRAAHHPRDGGGHRAHRLPHRAHRAGHGGGPALPVGGPGRRRGRDHRRRQLAHGEDDLDPPGASVPPANTSRWRSPAIPTAS